MNPIATLYASIGADLSGLQKGLGQAEGMLHKTAGGIGGIFQSAVGVAGGVLGAGVVTGLLDIGKNAIMTGINFNAMQENAVTAFTTMLGSGEKAQALLKDLQGFAASTPFEFPEIATAAKSLLAFGVGAEDMTVTLQRVGDISSGIGAPIGEIAELYGKAKVQGRLFGEDINQLTGRGIPIIQELAKQFGVSESEVKKLVEQGKVGFPNLEQAFKDLTSEGGQFSGMMEAQSHTFDGMMSTLQDTLGQIAGQIMGPLFNVAKQGLEGLLAFLNDPAIGEAFERISHKIGFVFDAIKGLVEGIMGGDVLGGITMFIGQMGMAFGMAEDSAFEMADNIVAAISGIFSGGLGGGVEGWVAFGQQILVGLQTAFNGLIGWITGSLVPALAESFGEIATAAMPTLQMLAGWINETLLPGLQRFAEFIGPILGQAFAFLGDFIVKVALPALTQLAVWILQKGLPALGELLNIVGGGLNSAFEIAGKLWSDLVRGFSAAVKFIDEIDTKLQNVASTIMTTVQSAFSFLRDNILQPVIDTLAALRDMIGSVISTFNDLTNAGIPNPFGSSSTEMGAPSTEGLFGGTTNTTSGNTIQFVYSPVVSLMNEEEINTQVIPLIIRGLQSRGLVVSVG